MSETHFCIWWSVGIHQASKGWGINKFPYRLVITPDLVNLYPRTKWKVMGLLYLKAIR